MPAKTARTKKGVKTASSAAAAAALAKDGGGGLATAAFNPSLSFSALANYGADAAAAAPPADAGEEEGLVASPSAKSPAAFSRQNSRAGAPASPSATADADADFHLAGEQRVILGRLAKRDARTKVKALGELIGSGGAPVAGGAAASCVATMDMEELRAFLPHWAPAFVRLGRDGDRRVRELACRCLGAMAERERKAIGPYFKVIVPVLMVCRFDSAKEVKAAAHAALDAAVDAAKQTEAFVFSRRAWSAQFAEWLGQSIEQMADDLTPTEVEREERWVRTTAGVLAALADVMRAVDDWKRLEVGELVTDVALWKRMLGKATAGHARVRVAAYGLLSALCAVHAPLNVAEIGPLVVRVALAERETVALSHMWEALLAFLRSFPDTWSHVAWNKAGWPALRGFAKAARSPVSYTGLWPLLSVLPRDFFDQPEQVVDFLVLVWTSQRSVDALKAVAECARCVVDREPSLLERVVANVLVDTVLVDLATSQSVVTDYSPLTAMLTESRPIADAFWIRVVPALLAADGAEGTGAPVDWAAVGVFFVIARDDPLAAETAAALSTKLLEGPSTGRSALVAQLQKTFGAADGPAVIEDQDHAAVLDWIAKVANDVRDGSTSAADACAELRPLFGLASDPAAVAAAVLQPQPCAADVVILFLDASPAVPAGLVDDALLAAAEGDDAAQHALAPVIAAVLERHVDAVHPATAAKLVTGLRSMRTIAKINADRLLTVAPTETTALLRMLWKKRALVDEAKAAWGALFDGNELAKRVNLGSDCLALVDSYTTVEDGCTAEAARAVADGLRSCLYPGSPQLVGSGEDELRAKTGSLAELATLRQLRFLVPVLGTLPYADEAAGTVTEMQFSPRIVALVRHAVLVAALLEAGAASVDDVTDDAVVLLLLAWHIRKLPTTDAEADALLDALATDTLIPRVRASWEDIFLPRLQELSLAHGYAFATLFGALLATFGDAVSVQDIALAAPMTLGRVQTLACLPHTQLEALGLRKTAMAVLPTVDVTAHDVDTIRLLGAVAVVLARGRRRPKRILCDVVSAWFQAQAPLMLGVAESREAATDVMIASYQTQPLVAALFVRIAPLADDRRFFWSRTLEWFKVCSTTAWTQGWIEQTMPDTHHMLVANTVAVMDALSLAEDDVSDQEDDDDDDDGAEKDGDDEDEYSYEEEIEDETAVADEAYRLMFKLLTGLPVQLVTSLTMHGYLVGAGSPPALASGRLARAVMSMPLSVLSSRRKPIPALLPYLMSWSADTQLAATALLARLDTASLCETIAKAMDGVPLTQADKVAQAVERSLPDVVLQVIRAKAVDGALVSHLHAWKVLLNILVNGEASASASLSRRAVGAYLRQSGIASRFLAFVYDLIIDDQQHAGLFGADFDATRMDLEALLALEDESTPAVAATTNATPIERYAAHVFFLLVRASPMAVRSWYAGDCSRRQKQVLEAFVSQHISSPLIHTQVKALQENSVDSKELKVRFGKTGREVTAMYEKEEAAVELLLKMPETYPLVDVTMECPKRMGMSEDAWNKARLVMLNMMRSQDGSLRDVLAFWSRRLDERFEGVDSCCICYSLTHLSSGALPSMTCRTCNNGFHKACLNKWFSSSGKSQCPLCQQQWR